MSNQTTLRRWRSFEGRKPLSRLPSRLASIVSLAAWQWLLAMRLASSRVSRLGNSCIARISVAVDIGEGLSMCVHNLEAARYLLNAPWCWESSHQRPRPRLVSRLP